MRGPRRRVSGRALLFAGLHLAVLSAFAVAQPLFDLLARNLEFFIARDSTKWDIIALALVLTFLVPGVLLGLEALVGLVDERLQRSLHLVFVGGLTAVFVLQVLSRTNGSGRVLVPVAAVVGALAAYAYRRLRPARTFLTVLGPAPLLFAGLFLLHSPATTLTLEEEAHASAPRISSRTPVVVLVLDEFPSTSLLDERGSIDAVRYPNFAALAGTATWFRNATTVATETSLAVPAILTGAYSKPDQVPIAAEHPRNLFTLLGRSYDLDVLESVTRLCPQELCPRVNAAPFSERMESLLSDTGVVYLHVVLPDDLRRRLPSIEGAWADFAGPGARRAEARERRALGGLRRGFLQKRLLSASVRGRGPSFRLFVASLQRSARPRLAFLHALLPHFPWEYLPSGRRYPNAHSIAGLSEDRWTGDEFLVEQGYQRHLLQVGYVDRLLGRLLGRLHSTGLLDRSLLVVTADHGVSFRAGQPRRGISASNLADLAFVPLFIKAPRQREGRIVDAPVETIDVLPTIADLLDVQLPWPVDGRSAFGSARRKRILMVTPSGEPLVLDPRALQRSRDALLARKIALFGTGTAPRGLFGIGPHPELLGARVPAAPRIGGAVRAELDQAELFENVQPRSGSVPARITGRIDGGDAPAERDLAVAVNGTVVAVGRSFEFQDSESFSIMVPESAFEIGPNEVDVFAVTSVGSGVRLGLLTPP